MTNHPKSVFGSFLKRLLIFPALIGFLIANVNTATGGTNPLMTHKFTADPAVVVHNGRVYIYCSHDLDSQVGYEMYDITCMSSDDLVNWTDHGEVFNGPRDTTWSQLAWAPMVVSRNSKFYMYFGNGAQNIGVVVSDSPLGPFTDPRGSALIRADTPGADVQWRFDPGVMVDDDGQAYMYFGGGGPGNARVIKLGADMISTIGSAVTINAPNFFEASFMHKRNGKYYYSYSADPAAGLTIQYMMSDDPMSGFVHMGTVLPNSSANNWNNNHHAFFNFGGNSYVAYHNRLAAKVRGFEETYHRSVCLDVLSYRVDGTMIQVALTATGVPNHKNLDPYVRVEAETIGEQRGIITELCSAGGLNVGYIDSGDYLKLFNVDFGSGADTFQAQVASATAGGSIELRLGDLNGPLIGTCVVQNTGGWQNWVIRECAINGVTGVHDLYLKFVGVGGPLMNLDYYKMGAGTGGVRINCGGPAVGSFREDAGFTSGSTFTTSAAVVTAGVADAAPASLYQSERFGNCTYTVSGLAASEAITLRLHFAEIFFTESGKRIFNVTVNGVTAINSLDIFALAGGNKALVRTVSATTGMDGRVVIGLNGVVQNAKISGIEVEPASASTNTAPTVATAAAANSNPVTSATTTLSVLGVDNGGESALSYTWATTGTPPAPVSFSVNGINAAKSTVATFTRAGSYNFQVTIIDAGGLTTNSSVTVTVNSTLTTIIVSPATTILVKAASQSFTASARDQFGTTLANQPAFTWSIVAGGVGSVSTSGVYTAPASGTGTAIVRAASGALNGNATVKVAASIDDGFLGSIWNSSGSATTDPLFGTVFDQITPENAGKWDAAEPTQGNFNWPSQDQMYALGQSKNLLVKHHVFVWGQQQPNWVTDANAKTAVTNWMTAYMQRYGDKMKIVDVVNEPLPGHAPAPYRNGLGGDGATGWDWVIWSFQKARDISRLYAPNARLILNDYNIINDEGAMSQYLDICNLLKDRGLLDGIGEQGHFFETSDTKQLRRNLDRLGALGLPLYITEFDLDIADDSQHAARFQELFTMFWEHARMRGITLWGHKQGSMWRTNGYLVKSNGTDRQALTWLRGYLAANPLPGKGNLPPTASAGNDQNAVQSVSRQLTAVVTDDGAPGAVLTQTWSVVSGPGTVAFSAPNAMNTGAQFSAPGSYTLRLTANDGVKQASDDVVVTVTNPFSNGPGTGITREWWTGISGTSVVNLTSNTRYPASPTGTQTLTNLFETLSNWDDNCGQRVHGYFIPPVTGQYTFYIASDDSSELWLSTSVNPANGVMIASVNGFTASREWTKYPSQKSSSINLAAGSRYYIRALHKEGGLGDNLSVGVDMPSGYGERPIAANRLAPWINGNLPPTVSAGNDRTATLSAGLQLTGVVTDDAASGAVLTQTWSVVSGPSLVTFSAPNSSVTLAQLSTPGTYTLRLTANDGVQANSDDVVVTIPIPNGPGTGITREWWTVITGSTVSNLTGNARYPGNPDGTQTLTNLFETPSDWGDNSAQRVHGFFIAPVSGDYTFYIASDNESELWLSTDFNVANGVKIASVNGFTANREWTKYPSQKSSPINLVAGNRYYIRALHKEGDQSDNLSVGVDMPYDYSEKPIAANRLHPWNSGNLPPTLATAATATSNPVNNTTTTLSAVGADDGGEPTLIYTWATMGTPPAAVIFSTNGTNAAKSTVATFTQPGIYTFQVTITDSGGLTITSSVTVTAPALESFDAWKTRFGLTGAGTDRSVPYLVAYAMGINPNTKLSDPTILTQAGTNFLYFVVPYTRSKTSVNVVLSAEMSFDLVTWNSIQSGNVIRLSEGAQTINYKIEFPIDSNKKVFFRFRAVQ